MNSFNVCSFVGRVPTAEVFKPTFVEGNETRRSRYSATLSVRRDRKKEGEQYYHEDLIRFTAWGPTADFLNKYAPPGTPIAIVGSLNVDTIEKDGEKRTYHSIMVDSARIVSGTSNGNNNSNQAETREEQQESPPPVVTNPFHKNNNTVAPTEPTEQSDTQDAPRFNPFGKGKG